jgi:hypothetical protein
MKADESHFLGLAAPQRGPAPQELTLHPPRLAGAAGIGQFQGNDSADSRLALISGPRVRADRLLAGAGIARLQLPVGCGRATDLSPREPRLARF